jgi:hypothetical protein
MGFTNSKTFSMKVDQKQPSIMIHALYIVNILQPQNVKQGSNQATTAPLLFLKNYIYELLIGHP